MILYQFVPDDNFPSQDWKAHKDSWPDNSFRVHLQGMATGTWIGYKSRGGYTEHGLGQDFYLRLMRFLGRRPRIAQTTGFLNQSGGEKQDRSQVEAAFNIFLFEKGFDVIVTPTLAAVTENLQGILRLHLMVPGAYLLRPLNPTVSKRYLLACRRGVQSDPNFDIKKIPYKTDSKGTMWVAWFNPSSLKGLQIEGAIKGPDGGQNLNQTLLKHDPNNLPDPIEFYHRVRNEVIYSPRII